MSTGNRGSDRSKRHLVRVARITAGIIFLILGVIGSLLPVLQGWLFFLLALITFFPGHPRVASVVDKAEPKIPRLVKLLRKLGIGVTEDEKDTSPGESQNEETSSPGENLESW